MIVTAKENYINVIMNLSAEDPFACRIISQYNSYDSSLAFVDYWTIIDDFNLNLYGSKSVSGVILKKSEPFKNVDESINFDVPDIKEVYNLIVSCADENFVPPPFDDFYVDVNHKLRHNATRMYGVYDGTKLVAMAMTVAESSNGAVLGAVSCHPDYRKHGYGSTVVKYISNRLIAENKTVYLHRAKNANQSFYNNLGFEQCGSWQEYYFER